MSYCERFGFDEAERARLLGTMELGEDDHVQAQLLQRLVIAPHAAPIVDDFYTRMLRQPAVAPATAEPSRMPRTLIR